MYLDCLASKSGSMQMQMPCMHLRTAMTVEFHHAFSHTTCTCNNQRLIALNVMRP